MVKAMILLLHPWTPCTALTGTTPHTTGHCASHRHSCTTAHRGPPPIERIWGAVLFGPRLGKAALDVPREQVGLPHRGIAHEDHLSGPRSGPVQRTCASREPKPGRAERYAAPVIPAVCIGI